jgi:hypothetical protein
MEHKFITFIWDVLQVNSIISCNPNAIALIVPNAITSLSNPKTHPKHIERCLSLVLVHVAPEMGCSPKVWSETPRELFPNPNFVLAQIIVFGLAMKEQHLSTAQLIHNNQMPFHCKIIFEVLSTNMILRRGVTHG